MCRSNLGERRSKGRRTLVSNRRDGREERTIGHTVKLPREVTDGIAVRIGRGGLESLGRAVSHSRWIRDR